MKLAGADVLVWVIIAVVIAISQGWKQLTQGGESPVEDEPAPPPPPSRPARPPSQPRPAARPAVPSPAWREDQEKVDQYRRRQTRRLEAKQVAPPVAGSPAWRVDQEKQYRRRLADRLTAKQIAPPPIVEVVPAPPPVVAAAPEHKTAVVRTPLPAPRRRSPWVEQLRDPRSVRQYIVANEILGPPKSG